MSIKSYATCRECWTRRQIRKDGMIREHKCPGGGKPSIEHEPLPVLAETIALPVSRGRGGPYVWDTNGGRVAEICAPVYGAGLRLAAFLVQCLNRLPRSGEMMKTYEEHSDEWRDGFDAAAEFFQEPTRYFEGSD